MCLTDVISVGMLVHSLLLFLPWRSSFVKRNFQFPVEISFPGIG